LDPDSYRTLAAATYAEMVLAGITTVVEFHYLHHAPGGVPYQDPNAMSHALRAAAQDAGIRLRLLDTCYLRADVDGTSLQGPQLRFSDGDADTWAARAAELLGAAPVQGGVAIHSVRACPPEAMRQAAQLAADHGAPLHLHLSEQPRENEACVAAYGRTPTELCADTGVLGPVTTAVHATHLTDGDVALLGGTRTGVCFCPTTERDLADGVGPAHALVEAGAVLSVGSDSHAVIDLFEEARAVELDERLVTGRRGCHTAESLLAAATEGGAVAAGFAGPSGSGSSGGSRGTGTGAGGDADVSPEGRIAPGARADFVAVRLDSPRLAGAPTADPVAAVVFAATASDVSHVVSGGQLVVSDGVHQLVEDLPATLDAAIRAVT
ncbi:MAG: formimidoylglutamate deiminase, partial [Micromonosporaceae bacterium]